MVHVQAFCFSRGRGSLWNGFKDNLRELVEYIVPPAKETLVENGKIRYIPVEFSLALQLDEVDIRRYFAQSSPATATALLF
jgi:hypothetical protein